ncbi:HDOD domain-containing protein [Granulosicoccaceae sp. 1_MG-2023]|nr:HDOD domain-containing protein [Granulosicoccaceae sp. 1_MG-2023]
MQATAEQGSLSLQEMIEAQIRSSDFELPVFSTVALKLQTELSNPDITIEDIEALIMEDASLAGQILRMANSAFYKGLGEINTVKRAILRLGAQQVANMAMLISQKQSYVSEDAAVARIMGKLWEHSFATAIGCRWIAENCGYAADANVAFLSGLLHDIGKVVILQVISDVQKQGTMAVSDQAIVEIINGELHTEIGHKLITAWALPEPFGAVVRDHHGPADGEHKVLLASVSLMNSVCLSMGFSVLEADSAIMPAATDEANLLGLSEIQLAELEILLEDTLQADLGV